MSETAVRAENLSKRYRLGASVARHNTLRDTIVAGIRNTSDQWVQKIRRDAKTQESINTDLWALRDISFDVARGEVFGIIGRNGAGKSTLLKLLSRITEPTGGRAQVFGRLGSLLEVGTGFHPELTGRENVYLSGAILGMHRGEIDQKFDQIVAFAEMERFLDTPVKRYSSGMYVRLAFSVAAHLEPDVLLVDEVLAVGDLAFQRRCLNQMRRLTESGKTILLVSHNMAAIQASCTRTLYLAEGRIAALGPTDAVIDAYRENLKVSTGEPYLATFTNQGASEAEGAEVEILSFDMFDAAGNRRRDFKFGEAPRIRIELYARKRVDAPMINFGIKRGDGVIVCAFNNWYDNFKVDFIEGSCVMEGWLPPLRLVPDYYEAHVLVWPWGGPHRSGDLASASPFAAATFGDFRIYGPGLNAHDGVFQTPAEKWTFRRGNTVMESESITEHSLEQVYGDD